MEQYTADAGSVVVHWRKLASASAPVGHGLRARVARLMLCQSLVLCSTSGSVMAQQSLDLFDNNVPVVLSASRLIQPVSSSPASITVIDAELIELSGARSITDLLRLAPGMQVGKLVNGNPVATYNGLSERYNPRLQLIVDGRPTYVPLYGGVPWSELPVALSDIERIEITRAPNAATFGPNSFSAVVSITTRAPAASAGWVVKGEAGGNEYRTGTLSYYGKGARNNYRLTLQSERDLGFKSIPDRERFKLGSFRSHWQLNETDRIGIDLGVVRAGHVELATVVVENDLQGYADTLNGYTQFVWERARASDDSWRVQYYFNYLDIKDSQLASFDLASATGNPQYEGHTFDVDVDRDSRSTRHEIEAQRTLRTSDKHRLVYGGAIRQDSVQGSYLFSDTRTRFVYSQRLFAHSEYHPNDRWLFNAGLLVENNSLANVTASPRFSLTWLREPGQHIRLGYSRGVRTPLLLEEEGLIEFDLQVSTGQTLTEQVIIDTTTIKPETSDVLDLSMYVDSAHQGLSFDTKLSYHRQSPVIGTIGVKDVETDTFNQEARTYDNRFNYRFASIELQADYKKRGKHRLRAAYAYAFGADRSLSERRLIPRHTLSLLGSTRLSRALTATAEYYFVSDWIWDDVSDKSRLNRLDVRLARRFKLADMDASFALQAELDLGGTVDYLRRNRIEDLYFASITVKLP